MRPRNEPANAAGPPASPVGGPAGLPGAGPAAGGVGEAGTRLLTTVCEGAVTGRDGVVNRVTPLVAERAADVGATVGPTEGGVAPVGARLVGTVAVGTPGVDTLGTDGTETLGTVGEGGVIAGGVTDGGVGDVGVGAQEGMGDVAGAGDGRLGMGVAHVGLRVGVEVFDVGDGVGAEGAVEVTDGDGVADAGLVVGAASGVAAARSTAFVSPRSRQAADAVARRTKRARVRARTHRPSAREDYAESGAAW